jgi:3-mercaptopyruvate sulfurtransferase SseA
MSQRAAWQLERLGFAQVYDFVVGKAHWLASGRPTIRSSGREWPSEVWFHFS